MGKRVRVAVLFGGRSTEHEVSLQSAASVIEHLDRERFEIVPVAIDRDGIWRCGEVAPEALPAGAAAADTIPVHLAAGVRGGGAFISASGAPAVEDVDVIFPVLHGPPYEDGVLQGLLELVGVAYVGSGVLGSALSMDKDLAKRVAALAGLPTVPSVTLRKRAYEADPAAALEAVRGSLEPPLFVKPCNMGSSVGVHKVKGWQALAPALADAFLYDSKILVEQAIDAREIEVAVLENDPLFVSVASEINPNPDHEFYSYEAKYLDDDGSVVHLPAQLDPERMDRVRGFAAQAFTALECNGFARVDFFLDRSTGDFYFNELNTLPGFTAISMYPKMIQASGMSYGALLTRLIELALERHSARGGIKRDRSA